MLLALVMLFAITAAWYSNVVHSTGMIFRVSGWGLDSSVNIQEQLTMAAPGTSGTVSLTVQNTSEGLINVNLNVAKGGLYNQMADMRKRLYFYIDDVVQRNGETTERVYLNSTESYSYTVLSQHSLVLGENGNGAPLTWEWVYDVLGYYFYGTVTSAAEAQIKEYLRPIEYEFDRATFQNGQLETVDGTTSKEKFLKSLSETDGYAGTVTTAQAVADAAGRVYYPVSVDKNGDGVWLYCCTLSEIEYETVVDTTLGGTTEEAMRRFQVYLNVVAQQKSLTVETVSGEQQLQQALNDRDCDMVRLTGNVQLSGSLSLSNAGEKLLDLAGYTLSGEQNGNLITVGDGSSLTVMNGTIAGPEGHTGTAIKVTGGDMAMSNVKMTGVEECIRIADDETKTNDSRVNITGCDFRCTSIGVFVRGNGSATAGDTCLTIENSSIISDGYYGLVGNGSVKNCGTDIYVNNSTIQGKYCGVYHPQRDSTLTIENSRVSGLTAMVIKGGTVSIVDTEIVAHQGNEYEALIQQPQLSNSGFADTGAAVYVETNYNYPCSVSLSGDMTVTAKYQDAVLKYEEGNGLYEIKITGGSYSHDVSAFVPDGYDCAEKDGRFVVEKKP